MPNYKIGDIIAFTYPVGEDSGTHAHDRYPRVLVLHPNWNPPSHKPPLLHGLNMNRLTVEETNMLRMLIDPFFEMEQRENLKKKSQWNYQRFEQIISKPGSIVGRFKDSTEPFRNAKINSPLEFYRGVIRPFLMTSTQKWDPYRKYNADKMTAVRVITPARIMTGEDSLAKWKREREQINQAISQALKKAKSADEKKEIEGMKKKLEHATTMSQRKSILSRFADWIRGRKGNQFRSFRKPDGDDSSTTSTGGYSYAPSTTSTPVSPYVGGKR